MQWFIEEVISEEESEKDRAGELLSKDAVLAGDQLEPVWLHWKLKNVNFTPVPQFAQCQHGCHPVSYYNVFY